MQRNQIFPSASPSFPSADAEGAARERLALFFLTMPPPARQNAEQRAHYRAALRELLTWENASILQAAGMARPLRRGDLAGLLRAVLEACATLAQASQEKPIPRLTVHIAPDFPAREMASFEPRLVQTATVGLLRAAMVANPGGPVDASLYAGSGSLILAVSGEQPACETQALAVARETARLHAGGLAVCEGTVGLSLSTLLDGETGRFTAPTSSELLRDALSCVQVGLYSALDSLKK